MVVESRAATLNVNDLPGKSCSDSGSGSALRPFCSLQLAVSRVRPGDVVEVSGGAYGPAELDVTISGTALAPIIIRAVPRRSAVIVGPAGAGDAAGGGVVITASYVVFEGFEVRDAAGTGIRNWGHHVTIRDNHVHDNARRCAPAVKCGQGIASNGSSPLAGVVIERNLSVRNGTSSSPDHDFYISSPGAMIRNNVAVDSAGFGFQIYPDCDACLVYNNVAWGNARNAGFLIGGDGATKFSSGVVVANNISSGNAGAGFVIYHNGVEVVTMRNNIAYGNTAGALGMSSSPAPINTDFLQVDPRFKNPGGLDFHLQLSSPAIDRGYASLAPPDDIDGDTRIIGSQVDIGVDEAVLGPPAEVLDLRFLDRWTMAWTGSSMAAGYALYRGGLAARPWVYDHACLASGLGLPTFADTQSPPPGTGFYYLVAGVNAAGVGTLGTSSSGVGRPIPSGCQ